MPDTPQLSRFFEQGLLRVRVLNASSAMRSVWSGADTRCSQIHLIRRGPVRIAFIGQAPKTIVEPAIVFVLRPTAAPLFVEAHSGAEMLRLTLQFAGGDRHPIVESLPAVVLAELAALPGGAALLQLFVDEVTAADHGRQATLDRLAELLTIRVVRYALERGLVRSGTLAALADPKLARVLAALHQQPARAWTLAEMAALAGMSRSRFALRFRSVTGATPADYLAAARIASAQDLLRARRPMKCVAGDVGYGSASGFTRAFTRLVGCSPGEWLKRADVRAGPGLAS
ncbi:MAG: hypothetical protein AMXMBFR72_27610 [Betaproteobacteria bacterium]